MIQEEGKFVCGCGTIAFDVEGERVVPVLLRDGDRRTELVKKPLSKEGMEEGLYWNVDWIGTMKKALESAEEELPCKEKHAMSSYSMEALEGCVECRKREAARDAVKGASNGRPEKEFRSR